MVNGLAGGDSIVNANVKVPDIQFFCQRTSDFRYKSPKIRMPFGWHSEDAVDVLSRNYKRMTLGQRECVSECNGALGSSRYTR
jgi:hypothetical protein